MKNFLKYLLIAIFLLSIAGTAIFFLFPDFVIKTSMKSKIWTTGLTHKQIKAGKHNWHYYEGGEKNKETIVFFHGYGANKFFWINALAHFKKKYHVISPDLPAFGENEIVWSENYGIESQVKYVNEFFSALKIDQVHLIGISMGGLIAGYYATCHPEKLKSLVLIDSGGVSTENKTDFWKTYMKSGKNMIDYDSPEGFDRMMKIVFLKPVRVPSHIKKYFVEEKKKRLKQETKIFKDLLAKGENMLGERLDRIQTPTLILWGEKDQVFDISTVNILNKGIHGSRVVIVKDAGHAAIVDNPKDSYQGIDDFLLR